MHKNNLESQLIDTHCHLDFDYAPKTADLLIQEGMEAGIGAFITIGTRFETFPMLQQLAETHPQVYFTVGLHPDEPMQLSTEQLDQLKRLASHPKCRAIGEIGLDYHYPQIDRDLQLTMLQTQLELAIELQKPVVIHSREAEADLLKALQQYAHRAKPPVGVIHCFSGTLAFAQACVELGFYISFSGILTFKNAESVRDAAKVLPLSQLLVETDSPFLAPVPHRGKKCEPRMVALTAQKLAEVKGLAFSEVVAQTTLNAKTLFHL
jgi:TatD DNase family protein